MLNRTSQVECCKQLPSFGARLFRGNLKSEKRQGNCNKLKTSKDIIMMYIICEADETQAIYTASCMARLCDGRIFQPRQGRLARKWNGLKVHDMPKPLFNIIKQHRKHGLWTFIQQKLSCHPLWLEVAWCLVDTAMASESGQNLTLPHVHQHWQAMKLDCMHQQHVSHGCLDYTQDTHSQT